MFKTSFRRVGFTLVELLVVVAIIALLVLILLPSLTDMRCGANQPLCNPLAPPSVRVTSTGEGAGKLKDAAALVSGGGAYREKVPHEFDSDSYTIMGRIRPKIGGRVCVWDLSPTISLFIGSGNVTSSIYTSTGDTFDLGLPLKESEIKEDVWAHIAITYDKSKRELSYFENGTLKRSMIIPVDGFEKVKTIKFKRTSFPGHLQGIDTDHLKYIFLSNSQEIKKIDTEGNEICSSGQIRGHCGDCAYHDGKVYAAFVEEFVSVSVKVFDAETLSYIRDYDVSRQFKGVLFPGGMAFHNGHFYVAEGIPRVSTYPKVYEYDLDFNYIATHKIDLNIFMGIQGIGRFDGSWWIGTYDRYARMIRLNDSFEIQGIYGIRGAEGFEGWDKDSILRGFGNRVSWMKKVEYGGRLGTPAWFIVGSYRNRKYTFNGEIGEVEVYKRALTPHEVKAYYQRRGI